MPGDRQQGESMNPQITLRRSATVLMLLISLGFLFIGLRGPAVDAQGAVQVAGADPTAATQGTVNLNVKVTGKGFKNGAKAKWLVTGTTDPGGVTVNSTSFVSSTELTANITVADTATIANFDIAVTNSDGRGGKGTELFTVTSKNALNCPAKQPPPSGDTKCYASMPGCLDLTFGGLGLVHTHIGDPTYTNAAGAVARQADGKIIVAGTARVSSTSSAGFALIRYNADGSLDLFFGDPDPLNPGLRLGSTIFSGTVALTTLNAMALQPDGKIVLVGTGSNIDGAVARYNSNGTLDAGFGNGGVSILNFGKRVGGAPNRDLAIQSDGKIVLTGVAGDALAVARLLPNGSPDSSFGSNGMVTANPGGTRGGASATGSSILIQRVPAITGEERIVIGGISTAASGANTDWTLMRFKPSGAVDTTFGAAGIVKTAFFGFGDSLHKLMLDSSNRIVAAGNTRFASGDCGGYVIDLGVVRYTQDGGLDSSFGGGKQTVDVYGGMDQFYGGVVQADGKILLVGYSDSADSSVPDFALVRLNSDGTRDSSFGLLGNGVVTTDAYGASDFGIAVALQTDGKIIVAGSSSFTIGGKWDIVVARYLP
jgi:uncharacterized delta-60 repeat protein